MRGEVFSKRGGPRHKRLRVRLRARVRVRVGGVWQEAGPRRERREAGP